MRDRCCRVTLVLYGKRTGDSHLLRNEEPVQIVPAPWLPSWKSCDSYYEISRAPSFESHWIDRP